MLGKLRIVLSHAKIFKAILAIIVVLLALTQKKYTDGIVYVIEDILAMIMYLLLVIVFMPKENEAQKGFPVEIFGFTYAVILMFYGAGALVFDIFTPMTSLGKICGFTAIASR